ncbi:hypothetical protein UFOVP345_30 [uncultured Caudovirales phage]|uniref:Tail fiber domain-containing protein n=1 Tax=uncultured Caudovirales phage TaxID=2100421 RepID=A0A6J5M628_9CAUD|nr:hypothetical protein UFOVP345_30 [uncultured Caudovirales phage]
MGGSRTSTQTQSSSTTPWQPQGDALKAIFGDAQNIYNAAKDTPGYQGDFTAGLNPTQRAALSGMLDAGGAFGDVSRNYMDTAGALNGSFQGARGVADRLASGDPVAQRLAQEALVDPTQSLIQNAGQYAANPFVDGMIDSVGRDISRNLNENALPSLNLGASAAGNLNSSRAGAAEAVLTRGAQDRLGDISASVRGDLFTRGLAMAADQRQRMFGNALAASGQDLNTMASGGQQLSGLGAAGAQLGATGAELGLMPSRIGIDVGSAYQAEDQRALDEAKMRVTYDENRPWENLSRFYGIVGDKSWGQNTTGTTTTRTPVPSALQTALGVGSMLAAPFTGGTSLAGLGMMGAKMGMGALGGMFGGGGGGGAMSPFDTRQMLTSQMNTGGTA